MNTILHWTDIRTFIFFIVVYFGLGVPDVYGAPTKTKDVVVFNGGKTGFDGTAEALAWKQAGFLDANGKPFTINGDNKIVNGAGTVVGTPILDASSKVIGWQNLTKDVRFLYPFCGANIQPNSDPNLPRSCRKQPQFRQSLTL